MNWIKNNGLVIVLIGVVVYFNFQNDKKWEKLEEQNKKIEAQLDSARSDYEKVLAFDSLAEEKFIGAITALDTQLYDLRVQSFLTKEVVSNLKTGISDNPLVLPNPDDL